MLDGGQCRHLELTPPTLPLEPCRERQELFLPRIACCEGERPPRGSTPCYQFLKRCAGAVKIRGCQAEALPDSHAGAVQMRGRQANACKHEAQPKEKSKLSQKRRSPEEANLRELGVLAQKSDDLWGKSTLYL